jgi:hypothetical protein
MSDMARPKDRAGGLRPEPAAQSQPAGAHPSRKLQAAIDAGREQGRLALFFGANPMGHYLHHPSGQKIWNNCDVPALPWNVGLMDGGLLKNGKRPDVYDGKVYWTVGGLSLWYAFFWWDRSGDTRRASNSGFYVRGFGWPETTAAFEYACSQFPRIVARQHHPLVLQAPRDSDGSPQGGDGEAGSVRSTTARAEGIAQ